MFDISNLHSLLTVEDGKAVQPHRGALTILPSCFPAELPKTSSPVLFTSRAGCCRTKLPGYLSSQGLSSQSHKPDRREGLCGQRPQSVGGTRPPFQGPGQPRSPSTTPSILLRQTWPGAACHTPQCLHSHCQRLAATTWFTSQPLLSAPSPGTCCHHHHPV